MTRLRHEEEGFTLVEMLVVILIGTVVMLALFGLVDMALPASRRINDRVETNSLGRNVMERIVRELRTASCARVYNAAGADTYRSPIGDPSPASEVSTGTKVTFYAAITNGPGAVYAPERRQIEFVGGQLIERRFSPTLPVASDGSVTGWSASSTNTVIADNIAQAGAVSVFSYYAYDTSGTLTQIATPGAADMKRIVQVGVRFKVLPQAGATPGTDTSTTFSDQATVRVPVDPAHPDQGPACQL